MSTAFRVSVYVDPLESGRVELVLSGPTARWSKIYDGSLFLSMDAQALDLLEEVPYPLKGDAKYRLKQAGLITVEQLERMRFTQASESEQQGID